MVDKPAGPTSHDVVERVRRELGARKAGHTGTLDPFATGVLPVCLGRATRLARFLAAGEKAYLARVRLGFATTTDDAEGEPLGAPAAALPAAAEVRAACAALAAETWQLPPAFSAKRIAGRRAYRLARRGESPALQPVRVAVGRLELLSLAGDAVELEVSCSGGTYVRALARDLGRRLGVGAHLAALRRTRSGGFGLEAAVGWDDLAASRSRVVPISELLPELPAVRVAGPGREAVRHGRDLPAGLVVAGFPGQPPPSRFRVLDEAGQLLALGVPRGFGPEAGAPGGGPAVHPDVVLVGPEARTA